MIVMVVVCSLWFYFVFSYHVAPGENLAKAWERICRKQINKLPTRMHKLFVFTPRIAPIGGMNGRSYSLIGLCSVVVVV